MVFPVSILLLLFFLIKSPTWATDARPSPFKGIVCNQCRQWCENTDLITAGSIRMGKAGPRGFRGYPGPQGPAGRPGDVGPRGKDGPVGPACPQGVVNMTLIEQGLDGRIKEVFEMFNAESCEDSKLESASARNDSGGVFKLFIPAIGVRDVFCDVADEGGNWTVFQRRMNGNVDFYRGWDEYVKGFGDLRGDYWLGLEALHQMTKNWRVIELKITMITREDSLYWVAKYSNFRIGPGSENYRLTVSGYSGNASNDALAFQNNRQFTTKDSDHDIWRGNCASNDEGGWWYRDCVRAHLNGNFHKTGKKGIRWGDNHSYTHLRYSEMKFRRKF